MRKLVVFLAVLTLVLAACSERAGVTPTSTSTTTPGVSGVTIPPGAGSALAGAFDPGGIQFLAAMTSFDGCDGVLDYFRTEALARVGPYGLGGGPWMYYREGFLDDRALEDSSGSAAATTVAAGSPVESPQSVVDFSGTNVQVSGVDEPDFVKTDGRRILTVTNGRLNYIGLDGADGTVLGTLDLSGGWNHQLLLHGDRVFVVSQGEGWSIPVIEESVSDIAPVPVPWVNAVTITSIDISDPARMRVERSASVEGTYVSARMVDGVVRLVTSAYPSDLPFVYPSAPGAEKTAEESNRLVVANSTLETWLPSFTVTDRNGTVLSEGLAVACDQMHSPAEFSGFETLSVMTIDLSQPLAVNPATGIVGRGETVYASAENLYVTSSVWFPPELIDDARMVPVAEEWKTTIHKFETSGTGPAVYKASGNVEGHVLNQFSLDEYNGHLRVATTVGAPWMSQGRSESMVTIFAEDAGKLVEVGRVDDLGIGERIYSVRFIAEAGYVVTFRQVDPLYVLDLRNPRRPRVTGELKIPGYSAYLHPVGPGLILGVGQDANDQGQTKGAKVSLFDVTNPENPKEIAVWTDKNSYTDVEWDHHAFTYWAPTNSAILPLQDWSSDFFGAVVLDTSDFLSEQARVEHVRSDVDRGTSDCEQVDFGDAGEGFYGGVVQVCGETDVGGVAGYYCDIFPAEEMVYLLEEIEAEFGIDIAPGPGERVELCWPDYDGRQPIQRSIVIGDVLWTVSFTTLQANSLETFEVLDTVTLP